ncbi:hypothetical protein GH714_042204 [Hevea brasiliensis]|uniref:Uncharacterized protein n=1 Tax=Hevea brasiliensis TaxID=3981 RepID=A0A6A6MXG1_HEVBR|nr:hypothetical protein GH714_042204 [Hevea brasiliensis]
MVSVYTIPIPSSPSSAVTLTRRTESPCGHAIPLQYPMLGRWWYWSHLCNDQGNHLGRLSVAMHRRAVVPIGGKKRETEAGQDNCCIASENFCVQFADLELLHQMETVLNPKGLCEISHTSSPMVLVCPGLQRGKLEWRIVGRREPSSLWHMIRGSRYDSKMADYWLLRVWLAVSSEKGTVHVFSLKVDSGLMILANDRSRVASEPNHSNGLGISSLSILKGVLPKYFSSEWSVAQFRLPEGLQYFVAFGHQKNTVVIIGMDGSFYRCEFDPESGGR